MVANAGLQQVARLMFIRHAEKLDEKKFGKTPGLNDEGKARAANLYKVFGGGPGSLWSPDVIFAMRKGDKKHSSNRPFLTVQPLAKSLGFQLEEGEHRKSDSGLMFNNEFSQEDRPGLAAYVNEHANEGKYDSKTLLFCWEHHEIPDIVAKLGLFSSSDQELTWGLRPLDAAEDPANKDNFTAVWVFTPEDGNFDFKVYKEFEVLAGDPKQNRAPEVVDSPGGYTAVVWPAS